MRYAFGLVGLLVALGVMVMIMNSELKYDHNVIKAGNKARDEAVQISGVGARDSINMEPTTDPASGKNDAILVKGIVPGGPLEQYYGLKMGDKIIEVSANGYVQKIKDMNDPEMAQAQVLDTYQHYGQITVLRGTERITLPAKASASATPAGTSSNSSNTAASDSLKALQNIPTH